MSKIDTNVAKLAEMIKSGELRLPEMQRRYVWPATRVRDLLDSLYRRYPSGMILVWETDREMPSRDLAVEQQASPFKGHKLLLDGQQRLTSLTAILYREPLVVRGKKKPIEILFNLEHPEGAPAEVLEVEEDTYDVEEPDGEEEEEEESIQERLKSRTFIVASRALSADRHWVKVSDIFDPNKSDAHILKSLVNSFEDPRFDKYSKRLQDVRRIREYPYVMHVLDKDLDYEEVAEIFVRVNSLGVKLRGSDLALALITSRWQNSLKLFEKFQEECEESWFTLELGLLVRALVTFTTHQSRFKTVGTISVASLKDGWDRAKAGIQFAIDFLRANAGIEDESLLSSPLFIITLGYYAQQRDFKLTGEEEKGLRRWLYVANARGHYTRGSSETTLDADLSVIRRGGGVPDLMETLKQRVSRFEIEPSDLAGRGQRSPLFAMTYLALKARGARDWRTQLGLSLAHQGRMHFVEHHHIFPKSLLKKAEYETGEINEIANMAFVTGGTNRSLSAQPPEKYLAEIVETQGKRALELHCVPTSPQRWSIDGYRVFLEERRAGLARAINDFMFRENESDPLLDVRALVALGEGDSREFKSSARWDYQKNEANKVLEAVIAKTIAGFLNAKGGTLLLGVSDDGQMLGLEADYKTLSKRPDRDGYQQFLVNLVSSTMGKETCSLLSISFQPIDSREVCAIRVEASPKPVYVADGAVSRFYLRTGNATQELNTKDAVAYIATRWKG